MPALSIFWFALTGLIFAIWAMQMFRGLSRLFQAARARADARGAMWPTPIEQLTSFRDFLTEPEYRRDRRRLLILTLLMFAAISGQMMLNPPT
ncbi:hypothetical protein G5B38_15215 [Pseudohalocynthiibacter aestuariivivens]|uniref:Uncharacterized protein n=1 Tax=Roseovarius pelagicus TaxID=2980108 RepID=A0ABY6DEW7_9RHOB|nr:MULTISPECIES: hypothetical protein [Rhodobacterales]QIE46763.1 hypothetical protein G5B38_15215 [Pseudohalocynthiibacter aestuariivivens]UXX84697.1 hypothetical protein N7U68_08705 [Roseovarius pelagicus]